MSQDIQKKRQIKGYDRDKLRPIIRSNSQNGEQTAGFKNLQSGEFLDIIYP